MDLVTRGISLTKDGVIVSTLKQATDYVQGTLPTGTWEAPSPLLYVRPADIQRGYDATTPKITDFTAFTLPSSIKILPDHLSSLSRELFADIVSTMPDDVDQTEYDDAADGCGIKLLPILYQEVRDGIDGDAGDAVESIILSLCQSGPSELAPKPVKLLFNEITEWNEVQEPHRVLPASALAGKFLTIMRRTLSKVDYAILEQRLSSLKALGNVTTVKTEVQRLLAKHSSHALQDGLVDGEGRAMQTTGGRDPRKGGDPRRDNPSPGAGEYRVPDWIKQSIAEGKEPRGPCPHCKDPDDWHWGPQCPTLKGGAPPDLRGRGRGRGRGSPSLTCQPTRWSWPRSKDRCRDASLPR